MAICLRIVATANGHRIQTRSPKPSQANALSRRPDLHYGLHKSRLLDNWSSDEADCDIYDFAFTL
jgi:hypothetical protein